MCSYKNLYIDDKGYVIQFNTCNSFQVCFGTTMLTMDESNFMAFVQMISRKKEAHVDMYDTDIKCVVIPTPSNTVHSILTQAELFQLHNMLEEADTEIKAQELMRLFSE